MQKLDISAITGRKSGAGYARRLQAIALANQALPDLMYLVTGRNYTRFTCGCALRGTLRTGFAALRFCSAEQNQQGYGPCASKLATQGKWGDDHGVFSL